MRNRFHVLALGLLLALAACAQPPATPTPDARPGPAADREAPAYRAQQLVGPPRPLPSILFRFPRRVALVEQEIIERINRRRAAARVPALTLDPRLTDAASNHSWQMAQRRRAFLVSPDGKTMEDRLKDVGATYRPGVWYGYAWGPVNVSDPYVMPIFILQRLEDRFLLSPNYRRLGVGVYSPHNVNQVYTTVFLAD